MLGLPSLAIFAEWSKATDLRSVLRREFVGSNPTGGIMNATYEFTTCRLLWSAVRYIIEKSRINHSCLICVESGGWIDHKFFLRESIESIHEVKTELELLEASL